MCGCAVEVNCQSKGPLMKASASMDACLRGGAKPITLNAEAQAREHDDDGPIVPVWAIATAVPTAAEKRALRQACG